MELFLNALMLSEFGIQEEKLIPSLVYMYVKKNCHKQYLTTCCKVLH